METSLNRHLSEFRIYLSKDRQNESMHAIYKEYIKEYITVHPESITENNEHKIIEYINNKIKINSLTPYKREHLFDAFNFFFNDYLGKNYKILLIAHLFQVNKIPIILTKEEIRLIFKLTTDVRHKCFFMLVYYCGAKPSQILHIKLKHIHPRKKTIELFDKNEKFIRDLQISDEIIDLMTQCKNLYDSKGMLFNWKDNILFNEKSMQVAFKKVLKNSKIGKKATLQTLRHSFAIHMLEECIDIKYVMRILGLTSKRSENVYLNYIGKININIIKTLNDNSKN